MTTQINFNQIKGAPVNILDYGASTSSQDNTAAIQSAATYATSIAGTLVIPSGNYAVSSGTTITIGCDSRWEGYITPTGYSGGYLSTNAVINITGTWTNHYGMNIAGSAANISSNVQGIHISGYNTTLYSPHVSLMGIGIAVRTYHCSIISPRLYNNDTGISGSAPDTNTQINITSIHGGVVSGSATYSLWMGDTRFATSLTTGEFNGSTIGVYGTQLMGSAVFNNIVALTIAGCDFEYASLGSGTAITIGSYVNGITVIDPYYSGYAYGIKVDDASASLASVTGLVVKGATYNNHDKSGVYTNSDFCSIEYSGSSTISTCFAGAPEIHAGRRQLAATVATAASLTWLDQGIVAGKQTSISVYEPDSQLTGATWQQGNVIHVAASTVGRHYSFDGGQANSGTLDSYLFTLGSAAEASEWTAGDAYDAGALGTGVVNNVNYATGVLSLSDSTATATAGTIIHRTSVWNSNVVTSSNAAPATGTWYAGDYARNGSCASGQPTGWYCTVAGTYSSASEAGTSTDGSFVITALADTSDFAVGQLVNASAGFASLTALKIRSIVSNTSITVDRRANATGACTLTTSDPTWVAGASLP